MNSVLVFGAIACFVVGASAQSTESALCQTIRSAIKSVIDECKPSDPPTEQHSTCMEEAAMKQDALKSMIEACADKTSDKDKADCFKSQIGEAGCEIIHEH